MAPGYNFGDASPAPTPLSESHPSSRTPGTAFVRFAPFLTVALLLIVSCAAVVTQRNRRLDHDEAQALHSAWLMGDGLRIYRDFMEDHPPYFLQALQSLRPADATRISAWAVRARVLCAVLGTWAMLAAAWIVLRMTGDRFSAALTFAALIGAKWTWMRGLADIRADSLSLALFMTGFLLVVWDRSPSRAAAWRLGGGIALAFAAEMVNPKWPLAGLALGVFFLAQAWRALRVRPALLVAMAVPVLAVAGVLYAALTRITTFQEFLFFTFQLKARNMEAFESQGWVVAIFRGLSPLHNAPPRFVGAVALALVLLTAFFLLRHCRPLGSDRAWRWLLVLTMLVATALEVRFLHPWPHLWPQFFLLYSFVMALVFGIAGSIVGTWLNARGSRASTLWAVAMVLAALSLAGPHLLATVRSEIVAESSATWTGRHELLEALRPGETVWIGAARHPIAARDASYLWYSFADLVPTTLHFVEQNPSARGRLPALTVAALPVCEAAFGKAGALRFLEVSSYVEYVPGACGCAQIVLSRRDVVPTSVAGVYEIVPARARPAGPAAPPPWDAFVRRKVAQCATR